MNKRDKLIEATIKAITDSQINLKENTNKYNDSKFLERVRKRFEDISDTTGREYKVDNAKEFPLDKWTLRDFIAEADYEITMRKSDIYDQSDRNELNKYKRFVDTYSKYLTDDIKCYEKHASNKYDLMESKYTQENLKNNEYKLTEYYDTTKNLLDRLTFVKKLLNKSVNLDNYETMQNTQIKQILKKYIDELVNSGYKGYIIQVTYQILNSNGFGLDYIKNENSLTEYSDAMIFKTQQEAEKFYDNFKPSEKIKVINYNIIDLVNMIKNWYK